jgi:hypothetical protein
MLDNPRDCNSHNLTVQSQMKKAEKLACHVVKSNTAINSLATVQISQGIVTLFEKIYDGEPILTVFSNIGEEARYNTDVSAMCMM